MRATGAPATIQDGSIGAGFISISPAEPATKFFDCGNATTGAARTANAAMLANINFKTMQSPNSMRVTTFMAWKR
jgi:hypothetical protein